MTGSTSTSHHGHHSGPAGEVEDIIHGGAHHTETANRLNPRVGGGRGPIEQVAGDYPSGAQQTSGTGRNIAGYNPSSEQHTSSTTTDKGSDRGVHFADVAGGRGSTTHQTMGHDHSSTHHTPGTNHNIAGHNSSNQPMTGTYQKTPGDNLSGTQQTSGTTTEERLERQGHLPGIADVQKDNEKDLRQAGEEDAAGNKIHRKGILGKILHWEHNGANAD